MTLQNDTLVYNIERIVEWQSKPNYDYNRELTTPEVNLYEILVRWIFEVLEKIFGSRFATDFAEPVLILLFIVVITLIVWLLYRSRPELFVRSHKSKLAYNVQEDTIYGIDLEEEIHRSLKDGNYKEASRFLYLQTLKYLSDKNIIDWQIFKTPTEYIYEVKPEDLYGPFKTLTNQFLRIRYGNYEATDSLFEELLALQQRIMKGEDK
ncbi:MAG: DUF4129 domain-containing protein [Bacteroides sp.]|nr:DUF4129 domain-containing protein [Bacteroides sp.]